MPLRYGITTEPLGNLPFTSDNDAGEDAGLARNQDEQDERAVPRHLPLHIDRPGAEPVAIDKLTLMAGLEVPHDVTSPLWTGARIRFANGDEYAGAVRVMPPQRHHGAPTLARLAGLLVVAHDRLIDPLSPRERAILDLRARDVLPFRVFLVKDLPYPLAIGEPGPLTELCAREWSRPLSAVDVAGDVSRLAPI